MLLNGNLVSEEDQKLCTAICVHNSTRLFIILKLYCSAALSLEFKPLVPVLLSLVCRSAAAAATAAHHHHHHHHHTVSNLRAFGGGRLIDCM
jgi:hypothetical protein